MGSFLAWSTSGVLLLGARSLFAGCIGNSCGFVGGSLAGIVNPMWYLTGTLSIKFDTEADAPIWIGPTTSIEEFGSSTSIAHPPEDAEILAEVELSLPGEDWAGRRRDVDVRAHRETKGMELGDADKAFVTPLEGHKDSGSKVVLSLGAPPFFPIGIGKSGGLDACSLLHLNFFVGWVTPPKALSLTFILEEVQRSALITRNG